jgi:mycobactin peptide synthetase MbtF
MININGQRTEPAEIEAVLLRQQEVEQAEVIVQQRNESAALTAFIVAHEGAAAGLQTRLRAALRQALPRHMVPARIILLDQLPRLPGGKLDAQALRMLAGGDA